MKDFKPLEEKSLPLLMSLAFIVACGWAGGASAAFAQTDLKHTNASTQEAFDRRRNDVMKFVHENHPKMETLLLALEEGKPVKFRAAINRISKTLAKMKSLKKKHPERYAASVQQWKVKSEIEMLTARLANAQRTDEAMRTQLDALIESFVDNRKRMLELERKHLQQRLERTERLLDSIENDRETFVKKNMRSIERTIKQLKSGKPGKK